MPAGFSMTLIARYISSKLGRLIYQPDGIDDRITFPQIQLSNGDTIGFKFVAPTAPLTSNSVFLSGNLSSLIYIDSNTNDFRFLGGVLDASMDGAPLSASGSVYPQDGSEHLIEITMKRDGDYIDTLYANSASTVFCELPVFNLEVGGRFYPINDGWGANPVIKDILGDGTTDGTAHNFEQENWVVKDGI